MYQGCRTRFLSSRHYGSKSNYLIVIEKFSGTVVYTRETDQHHYMSVQGLNMQSIKIMLANGPINENEDELTYLGSVVSTTGDTDQDEGNVKCLRLG